MQTTLITVIGIALIVMAIFLVISVLMQSSKNNRGVGSVAGGAETFFGKTKGKTMDALFNKLTTVVTIIFVILVIVLYIIQPDTTEVPELVLPENEVSDVIDDAAQAETETEIETETADDAATEQEQAPQDNTAVAE